MSIKNKAINLLERQLTKPALVLETRGWHSETFYEIDLHIPDADFNQLKGVAHLKCRVAPLTFRDYTIAKWDDLTKTCTLFVDAAHNGPGSSWVKSLNKQDQISYMQIETHRYPAMDQEKYLFLGDQSTIGHFLALQQLGNKNAQISGALVIDNKNHREELTSYYPELSLTPVALQQCYTQSVLSWLQNQPVDNYDMICLAGNSAMVVDVRQYLRKSGVPNHKIKAQGFWR